MSTETDISVRPLVRYACFILSHYAWSIVPVFDAHRNRWQQGKYLRSSHRQKTEMWLHGRGKCLDCWSLVSSILKTSRESEVRSASTLIVSTSVYASEFRGFWLSHSLWDNRIGDLATHLTVANYSIDALIIILKAPIYLQYQQAFLSDELEFIFANAPVTRAPVLDHNYDESDEPNYNGVRKPIDGECPICVFDMEADEDLVWWVAVTNPLPSILLDEHLLIRDFAIGARQHAVKTSIKPVSSIGVAPRSDQVIQLPVSIVALNGRKTARPHRRRTASSLAWRRQPQKLAGKWFRRPLSLS